MRLARFVPFQILFDFLDKRPNLRDSGDQIFDPCELMGLHVKDDINIFHSMPSKPVSINWNCNRKVPEKWLGHVNTQK